MLSRPKTLNLSKIVLWFLVLLITLTSCDGSRRPLKSNKKPTVAIHGAYALYPLAEELAERYQEIHPEIKIDVFPASSTKGITDVKLGLADIGMFSGIYAHAGQDSLLYFPVAVDAVVPTMNSNNPAKSFIEKTGIKKVMFREIFVTGGVSRWDKIEGVEYHKSINVYARSDASGASMIWAEFLGCDTDDFQGTGVYGDVGMTAAIRQNENSIGYDNLRFVFDIGTGQTYPGLEIVPMDLDGDGLLEPEENFNTDLATLHRAIKEGRYPDLLSRTLYFIISPESCTPESLEFLLWVYTEGKSLIRNSGYVELHEDQMEEQEQKIKEIKINK